jgi:modulator of FtsH protease HflK
MNDHPHSHLVEEQERPTPETPLDPGSQALSEALRSSFAIVKFVMVVLVIVFFGSGFFIVGPQERAIILRFGKPVGEGEQALRGPGLHWSYPYPIDEYVKVSITGIQQVRSSVGWYATTPEQELAGTEPYAGPSLNPAVDGYALTADGNIVHTRATLYYRIEDPVHYVFNFANAPKVVQQAVDNALLYTAARFPVDDILTRDQTGFKEAVQRRASELLARQNVGVVVEQCDVQSRPPRFLNDAFASVLKAEVTRSKVLDDARSIENQVVSKASADADSIINAAESERARRVTEVAGLAEQFKELLPQYERNPSLFVQKRLTETFGRVMASAQDKIFLPGRSDGGKPRELRLELNREPRARTEATP